MNGEQPTGEERPEPTFGDKIREMQSGCVDDCATFAKAMFDLYTHPGYVLQPDVYMKNWIDTWRDLFTGCATRLVELRQIIADES